MWAHTVARMRTNARKHAWARSQVSSRAALGACAPSAGTATRSGQTCVQPAISCALAVGVQLLHGQQPTRLQDGAADGRQRVVSHDTPAKLSVQHQCA